MIMEFDSLLNGDYTAETTEDYGEEILNLPCPDSFTGRDKKQSQSTCGD